MSSNVKTTQLENQAEDWEARYVELAMAHEAVKSELTVSKLNYMTLSKEFENETEVVKHLKTTMALQSEYEKEVDRTKEIELQDQVQFLRSENEYLQKVNSELMTSLADSRNQTTDLFRKCDKTTKESRQQAEELEKLKSLRKEIEEIQAENTSSMSIFEFLKDLGERTCQAEVERLDLIKMSEDAFQRMSKEINSLESQKEDILNHSKNCEKVFKERIAELTERLENSSKTTVDDDKNLEIKFNELRKKHDIALEAILEMDEDNSTLRDKLNDYIDVKIKLEGEMEIQKKFYDDEKQNYESNNEKYENHIATLNEQMSKLEDELKTSNEKQVKLRISFANDKANFWHDMERAEENWNCELSKMKEQMKNAESSYYCSLNEERLAKEKYEEDLDKYRKTVTALESIIATDKDRMEREVDKLQEKIKSLTDQLKEADESHLATVKDWDAECDELEEEINELLSTRRTESKRMKTMTKKNYWLISSIRALAEQRRREIDSLKTEKQTLTDRCELLRKEKDEWLSDLKRDMNAWKEESIQRQQLEEKVDELESKNEKMENRIGELQSENDHLEEKIELVTERWREECTTYEGHIAVLMEKESSNRREHEERLRTQKEASEAHMELLKKHMLEMIKNKEKQHNIEMAEQYNERTDIIKNLKKEIMELKQDTYETARRLRQKTAHVELLKMEAKTFAANRDIENKLHNKEMEEIKTVNKNLRENMGVETLDDTEEDSSDDEFDGKRICREEEPKEPEDWDLVEEQM